MKIEEAEPSLPTYFRESDNVTIARHPDAALIQMRRQTLIKVTNSERATMLAALRRWQSYPAGREADAVEH